MFGKLNDKKKDLNEEKKIKINKEINSLLEYINADINIQNIEIKKIIILNIHFKLKKKK